MKNMKIWTVIGVALLAIFVIKLPFDSKPSGMTDLLREWGTEQSDNSDKITNEIVSDIEEPITGKHEVDGSNWSLPNILRNLANKITSAVEEQAKTKDK